MDQPLKFLLEASRSPRVNSRSVASWFFDTLAALEESESVCYLLDHQLRLVYCNPAWDRFAESNDAHRLTGEALIGTPLFASIPSVLASVYTQAFQSVSTRGQIWTKVYQCSSPDRFRKFRMRIHPWKRRDWFLVTNALVVDRPHKSSATPDQDAYFSHGAVTMCAHCRCVRSVDTPARWDFVPAYLRLKGLDLLKVSHGLCPFCQTYFYSELE